MHRSGAAAPRPAYRFHSSDVFPPQGLPLRASTIRNHVRTRLHDHEFEELVLIEGGAAIHQAGRAQSEVGPGDLLFIPRGAVHGYPETQGLALTNILFESRLLGGMGPGLTSARGFFHVFMSGRGAGERGAARLPRLRLGAAQMHAVREIARELEEELRTRAPGYREVARAHFVRLIAVVTRAATAELGGREGDGASAEDRNATVILDLAAQMAGSPAAKWSVAELAERGCVSEAVVHRGFKRVLGTSPHDYLIALRLDCAMELLEQTGTTVAEIASLCGVEDPSYFSRLFRRRFGMSPNEYRARGRRG